MRNTEIQPELECYSHVNTFDLSWNIRGCINLSLVCYTIFAITFNSL